MTCTAAERWESSLNYRLCRQYHSLQRRANNFRGGKSQTNCVVQPKKPKLEQVTFSYCVISNTKIVHNLMISRKLNSLGDIQNYLGYKVKVMELSNRFQWPSILQNDDQFCYCRPSMAILGVSIVTIYTQLSWSPFPNSTRPASQAPVPSTQFTVTTSEARTVCCSYNSLQGCSFPNCVNNHACNQHNQGGGHVAKATLVIAMLIPSIHHSLERGPPRSDYAWQICPSIRVYGYLNWRGTQIANFWAMAFYLVLS